jgi:hypothetical protein
MSDISVIHREQRITVEPVSQTVVVSATGQRGPQGVPGLAAVYTNAAARDADITVPIDGQTAITLDNDILWQYVNSAWVNRTPRTICTSSTRPSSPFEGQEIYETDTDRILVYNGGWVRTGYTSSAGRTGATGTRSSGTQAVANNTVVDVTLPTETFDSDGYMTAGGTTMTIPSGLDGLYIASCKVALPTPAAGNWIGFVFTGTGAGTYIANPLSNSGLIISWNGRLVAGDTIKAQMYQISGSPVNIVGVYFDLYRIGP